jgi:Transposase IS200 like
MLATAAGGRLAWCLVPNHVHVVIEILDRHSLSATVGNWKSFTAKRANAQLGRSGSFWHADYFDRYMRDEGHLVRTIEYVECNPVKAGLVEIASDWPWSSARLGRPERNPSFGPRDSGPPHERAGRPRSAEAD